MTDLVAPSPARAAVRRLRAGVGAGGHAGTGVAAGATAIVAAGALLRAWNLTHQSLWHDEAVTRYLLGGTAGQLLTALPRAESTPPLYYLVAWGWTHLFGDTALGLRSLSAVAGTAVVGVAFAAGRTLAGVRTGLIAAALVAVNPLLVWYSQEARSYSLLTLATATSLWLYARARAEPSRGRLIAWACVGSLALATHYFAAFVVGAEALLVLVDRRPPLRWRAGAAGAVGAVALSLVALALRQSARHYWFADIPLPRRILDIPAQFMTGFEPASRPLAVVVAAAIVTCSLLLLAARAGAVERHGAALAGGIGVAATALPAAAALLGADYLNARNVIGGLVPLAVAVAAGLAAPRAGPVGVAATGLAAVVSVALVATMAGDPAGQRPDWHAVAAALARPALPRAVLLRGSTTWGRPLAAYLPETWWVPPRGAAVRELDVVRRLPSRARCPSRSWWGLACAIAPGAPLRAAPAGFALRSTRRVAGFEVARYRAARPRRLYAHWPYEHFGPHERLPAYYRHRKLLLTPTAPPVLP